MKCIWYTWDKLERDLTDESNSIFLETYHLISSNLLSATILSGNYSQATTLSASILRYTYDILKSNILSNSYSSKMNPSCIETLHSWKHVCNQLSFQEKKTTSCSNKFKQLHHTRCTTKFAWQFYCRPQSKICKQKYSIAWIEKCSNADESKHGAST